MGGNAQISFRVPAEWLAALDMLAANDEGAQATIKALIYPFLTGAVEVARDDDGRVTAFTGRDAKGKRVTIRCDAAPPADGADPLPAAPRRGRPPKSAK